MSRNNKTICTTLYFLRKVEMHDTKTRKTNLRWNWSCKALSSFRIILFSRLQPSRSSIKTSSFILPVRNAVCTFICSTFNLLSTARLIIIRIVVSHSSSNWGIAFSQIVTKQISSCNQSGFKYLLSVFLLLYYSYLHSFRVNIVFIPFTLLTVFQTLFFLIDF